MRPERHGKADTESGVLRPRGGVQRQAGGKRGNPTMDGRNKQDRRTEFRYATDIPCTLIVLNGTQVGPHDVRLIDVSQQGAMVTSPGAVPLRANVQLVIAGETIDAKVARVRKVRVGWFRTRFQLGLRLKRLWPNAAFSKIAFPQATMALQIPQESIYERLFRG